MVRRTLRIAAGALALVVAAAWWWPDEDDRGIAAVPSQSTAATAFGPEAAQVAAPADATPLQAAFIAAAARVCADGCEEPQAAERAAVTTFAAAEPEALPLDLDAWSLAPEPLRVADEQVAAALSAPRPLFNTPSTPDENDATPTDETDPYASPAEEPAVE
jgi:hypothetical protein